MKPLKSLKIIFATLIICISQTANASGHFTSLKESLACEHWNVYGDYAEGGGCNLYGCWPPGGSCNIWGCSAHKECTATGCPNKIKSFKCIEDIDDEDEADVAINRIIKAQLACAHWNVYGDYAEGGGCNLYGCWPPGGSCNIWGCSAYGECTVTDCPAKIDSFKCKK